MLNDGAPFSRIYLKVGRTDLRKGIDGLATIVKTQIHLDPFQKNAPGSFSEERAVPVLREIPHKDQRFVMGRRWIFAPLQAL